MKTWMESAMRGVGKSTWKLMMGEGAARHERETRRRDALRATDWASAFFQDHQPRPGLSTDPSSLTRRLCSTLYKDSLPGRWRLSMD